MQGPIVVGVDGSDTASKAAARAAALATALGVDLHVVCAYGRNEVTEVVGAGSDRWVLSTADDAEGVAKRDADQLRTPDLNVVAASAKGSPAAALVDVATRLDASIIVVGNKRVQGISRILGSIARDVAQHAPCDVLIAKTV